MKLSNLGSRTKKPMSSLRSIVAAMPPMLVLCALNPSPAKADPLFAAPLFSATGFQPECVAIGDFNHDGKPDLATAHRGQVSPGTVSVLLGNGDGTFAPNVGYEAAQLTSSVAVGDVNRDGKLDLVATGFQIGQSFMVFLGNGDGTFRAKIDLTGGGESVAIGDLNGDGNPDLAAAGEFADNQPAVVRLGNGDGTFQGPLYLTAGEHPRSVAIGDLNSDGNADLVVADNNDRVWVFLWNEDGTYRPGTSFPTGESSVNSVAIGDLNEDGKPDLAVGGDFSVSILLGNGEGTFGAPSEYVGVGAGQRGFPSIAISDLNLDENLDVVCATSNEAVSVLLGNGDGTLGPSTDYAAGLSPSSVAVGDLNRDGKPDVVTANIGLFGPGNTVSVLLNIGPNPIRVDFDFRPHLVYLNSNRKWVTGTLEVPVPYRASQIDVSSIRLNGVVAVATKRSHRGDHETEHRGRRGELTVKFAWDEVKKTLAPGRRVPVTVTGTLAGQPFKGTDHIRVKGPKRVRVPKSGDMLAAGSAVLVSWDADEDSPVGSVTLLSSLDDGVTWKVEAEGLPGAGSRAWIVPTTRADHARLAIRVTYDSDDTEEPTDSELAMSDAFSIAGTTAGVEGGAAAFALQPKNPVTDAFTVRFSLMSSAGATLEAFDVRGRRMLSREVGSRGPGWHMAELGDLPAGLYLLRLSQAGRSLVSRVAVIR